jgi:hypothetical protein
MKKKAFTLIEFLIILMLIVMFIGVVIPAFISLNKGEVSTEKNVKQEKIVRGNIVEIQPTSTERGQFLFITFKDGRYLRFFVVDYDNFKFQKNRNHAIHHIDMKITKVILLF